MKAKKQKYELLYQNVESGLDRVLNKFNTTFECMVAMNSLFENISQIFEFPQTSKYNLNKILKGSEFHTVVKEFPEEKLKFFIEFIDYPKAPGGFVVAVSTIKIDETLPIDANLFVLKEEMVEKFSNC
jgi:hypothetical protein